MYITSWFGAFAITLMLCLLFVLSVPLETGFEDPVFEPMFMMMDVTPAFIIIPVSVVVLKIKHRSMWWLLLFLWYSPLWLPDIKQQCKANYVFAILILDTVFLTYGLTYTLEYAQRNPLDTI